MESEISSDARGPEDWAKRLEAASKIRLVVCGGRREFMTWCRQAKLMPNVEALHLTHEDQLRGRDKEKYQVVIIGTGYRLRWWACGGLDIAQYLGLTVREA